MCRSITHSSAQHPAAVEPRIRQVFLSFGDIFFNKKDFDRRLYLVCQRTENEVEFGQNNLTPESREQFYICILSGNRMIYKGMLNATQLRHYYLDLKDPEFKSALAMVHSRFSTNTFGDELHKMFPILTESGSDSATLDNMIQFLAVNGRSLPHAMLMAVPEAWQNHTLMDSDLKAFYEYHACLMEPWDGPASISFTNGTIIGGNTVLYGATEGEVYFEWRSRRTFRRAKQRRERCGGRRG